MRVFAGDIGGTKTLLQIADVASDHYQVIYEQRFDSQRYDDFLSLAQNFLASAPHNAVATIEDACIAVAGPVESTPGASTRAGQHAQVTNLPWQIEARSLAATLRLPRLLLINDFQAIGHAIDTLSSEDFVVLQAGQHQPRASRIIIGAGTGLGVAQMIWQAGRYHIIPSEGGHADFAPADETQMALLRYMQGSFPHVSYDRILCGAGLMQIYAFLQAVASGILPPAPCMDAQVSPEAGCRKRPTLAEPFAIALPCASQGAREQPHDAAAISAAASTDPVARAALELFVSIYGAQAGNLALFNLAYGGVYVAGGMAPKILPYIEAGGFMQAFSNKGRMAGLMSAMPVSIITHAKVGVMGAARAAAGM